MTIWVSGSTIHVALPLLRTQRNFHSNKAMIEDPSSLDETKVAAICIQVHQMKVDHAVPHAKIVTPFHPRMASYTTIIDDFEGNTYLEMVAKTSANIKKLINALMAPHSSTCLVSTSIFQMELTMIP